MLESHWLQRLGPPSAAIAAIVVVAGSSLGASGGRPPLAACAGDVAAAVRVVGNPSADGAGSAWVASSAVLDSQGTLAGRRVEVGRFGQRTTAVVDLPAESSTSGPFGRVVLTVADDGLRSTVAGIDAAQGCAWTLGTSGDVVRSATLDASDRTLYDHRVDRRTRADLGVWATSLDRRLPPRRVLAPIDPDPRFGPTFATVLGWAFDGPRLVVQSCAESACRIRTLDTATGVVTRLADPTMGEVLVVTGDVAIGYASCLGLPCPLISTSLETGRHATLVGRAGSAVAVTTPSGPAVAYERDGGSGSVGVVAPDGHPLPDLALGPGARLVARADVGPFTAALPGDMVLVADSADDAARGSRRPDSGLRLVDVLTGRAVALPEVLR